MTEARKSQASARLNSSGLNVAADAGSSNPADTVQITNDPQPVPGPETELCLSELIRYYRHSCVGRHLTGILHNMNTPLQVISFHLELLAQKGEDEKAYLSRVEGDNGRELLNLHAYRTQKMAQLQREAENLQTLVQHLLNQGLHEDQEEQVYLDLNSLLQEELELFQADLFYKHQVEKVFSFCDDLPPIYAHYIDFAQSFRNLVENALEAMTSATTRVLKVETRWEGEKRLICVGDTGPGIPRDIFPRLFEPFVTSKDTAAKPRAGLGLFMAHRLLAPYQAQFQVKSTSGGTLVTVMIPQKKAL